MSSPIWNGRSESEGLSDTDPLLAVSCEVIGDEHEISDEIKRLQGDGFPKPEFASVIRKVARCFFPARVGRLRHRHRQHCIHIT